MELGIGVSLFAMAGTLALLAYQRRVIARTGSVAIPAGARTMNLAGHTVIPGLVGLHDHTFYTTSQRGIQANFTSPLLYLASGVTTLVASLLSSARYESPSAGTSTVRFTYVSPCNEKR